MRLPLPRPTVRLRLTLTYGALFLASGAVLVTVTYLLVSHNTAPTVFGTAQGGGGTLIAVNGAGATSVNVPFGLAQGPGSGPVTGIEVAPGFQPPFGGVKPTPQQLQNVANQLTAVAAQQHDDQMHQLLVWSAIALGGMAVLAIALGWLIAGRVLRPLRTITDAAQSISASNLHRRLDLRGPNDELKELGNTFDGLLGRLERSFDAQRQFVANASHELRTPLARQRTMMEVALRDPQATADTLRAAYQRVLVAAEQQERIIEALLTLARSERGLDRHEACDLTAITEEVVLSRRSEAEQRGVHVETGLGSAQVSGDPYLVERLVTNLVDNAIRHNAAGGRVRITTATAGDRAVLSVSNTGPVIPSSEVDALFRPFVRFGVDRTAHADGVGLGLSIVKAIADAHAATLTVAAPPSGGLEIEVSLPGRVADG